jgi:rubredoxin
VHLDPVVVSRLGLLRASRTDAALDFAHIPQPTAQELLSVQPAASRVLFCAPRVQAMARVSTPAEEAERAKADKARKTNTSSPWHTHSTDQLQLFVFTAWQVIFQETPNTALLGFQLGLAANWHVSDQEDFANQGPFLVNRQEGARLFTTLESAVAACNRAQPPGSLSPALTAQIRSNIIQFFRLRAETILPWCHPSAGTPHHQDVTLIARAIVSQYSGVRRALDYAQKAVSELCAGRHGEAQLENAAFLSIARPFYEAYLRNGMGHSLASAAVKQALAFVPPPFLAAASGDTAAAWAALIGGAAPPPAVTITVPPPPAAPTDPPPAPPPPGGGGRPGGRASPPRQRSPARNRSPGRLRSLPRPRRSPPPRAQDPEPLAVPTSRAIVGGVSPHAPSSFRCPVCSFTGHRGYECPKAFFRAFGRVMPGQRADGSQDPTAWERDELVPAARADLAEFLRWTRVPLNRRCPVSVALIAAGP